jgi:hypothetical protein
MFVTLQDFPAPFGWHVSQPAELPGQSVSTAQVLPNAGKSSPRSCAPCVWQVLQVSPFFRCPP